MGSSVADWLFRGEKVREKKLFPVSGGPGLQASVAGQYDCDWDVRGLL